MSDETQQKIRIRIEKWNARLEKYGPGKPFWPQSQYWVIRTVVSLFLIALAGMWQVGFRAVWQCDRSIETMFPMLSVILLIPVFWFLFVDIRRKIKTGSFLPTPEEMRKNRTRAIRPIKQSTEILNANLWVLASAISLQGQIVHYLHHGAVNFIWLVLSLFWVVLAILWIGRVLAQKIPPKSAMQTMLEEVGVLSQPAISPAPRMKRGKLLAWIFLPSLAVLLLTGYIMFHYVYPDMVIYPAATQAHSDLAAALHSAAIRHKRVLLDFGDSSCRDCQVLDQYLHDPANRALLDSDYILVRINVDNGNSHDYSNANEDLAYQYAVPLDKGVPALAVVNEKGELIYSQQHGEFEAMRHLQSSDLTSFLMRWK